MACKKFASEIFGDIHLAFHLPSNAAPQNKIHLFVQTAVKSARDQQVQDG